MLKAAVTGAVSLANKRKSRTQPTAAAISKFLLGADRGVRKEPRDRCKVKGHYSCVKARGRLRGPG
jgi:hypothetical protein